MPSNTQPYTYAALLPLHYTTHPKTKTHQSIYTKPNLKQKTTSISISVSPTKISQTQNQQQLWKYSTMEENQDTTFKPFGLPATPRHSRRLRRSTSSLIFSSGGFLVLLVAALAFVFIVIPSLHSFFTGFTSHILRPNSVKKSWDSLNLVLVLFAVLCGFLGRNAAAGNEESRSSATFNVASAPLEEVVKSGPSTPRQWYDYSDRTVYNDNGANRMRSSSSYPDLRQDSELVARDERWRSYDDFHVSNYQVPESNQLRQPRHRRRASWHEEYYDITNHVSDYRIPDAGQVRQQQHRRRASWHDGEYDDVTAVRPKNIPVDTFVIRTERASTSDISVVPPPLEPKRTYDAVEDLKTRHDEVEVKSSSFRQMATVAASQSPPVYEEVEMNSQKREKKTGVATTKEFITSLGKNKKRRHKSIEDFQTQLTSAAATTTTSPSPIPPPPSVFHSLFQSKKPKPTKTHHSLSHPPQPLISAPRMTSSTSMMTSPHNPPLPLKLKSFKLTEEAESSGGESPLPSGIPPPPPLPPFRMQAMKFVKHGDFVRIKSNNSSSRSSDDDEGGDVSPMSRDVNTKADTFIARVRAGLKLEKINSVNQRGRSNLGPGYSEGLGPL